MSVDRYDESVDSLPTATEPRTLSRRRASARRAPSRIALFGLFGCGNLGNEGSLEAMVELLRRERPKTKLSCICKDPDIVRDNFAIETVSIRLGKRGGISEQLNRLFLKIPSKIADFSHAVRYLRGVDALVFPGTGILDDFGERPAGMPYDILKWCLAARLTGTRIAFVSIGAGPIRNRLSRFLMISAARLAHYRSYRDQQSREFMESAGFDTKPDTVFPDIAFSLPQPMSSPRPSRRGLRVGVGVMAYRGWYGFAPGGETIFARYIALMAKFVVELLDRGHDCRILMGDHEDAIAVEALRTAVREARPHIASSRLAHRPVSCLSEVMEEIAQTDIVVATRFHNVVCSLMMGKPTISLSYARKNDVLMTQMGLGEYCQHIENIDLEHLHGQFARLNSDSANYERTIRAGIANLREKIAEQNNRLLAEIIG